MSNKFAKIWNHKKYTQIVLIKQQNDDGEPCISFFFQPDGHGICKFNIGFEEEETAEAKTEAAFDAISLHDAVEIIDGYLDSVGVLAN